MNNQVLDSLYSSFMYLDKRKKAGFDKPLLSHKVVNEYFIGFEIDYDRLRKVPRDILDKYGWSELLEKKQYSKNTLTAIFSPKTTIEMNRFGISGFRFCIQYLNHEQLFKNTELISINCYNSLQSSKPNWDNAMYWLQFTDGSRLPMLQKTDCDLLNGSIKIILTKHRFSAKSLTGKLNKNSY